MATISPSIPLAFPHDVVTIFLPVVTVKKIKVVELHMQIIITSRITMEHADALALKAKGFEEVDRGDFHAAAWTFTEAAESFSKQNVDERAQCLEMVAQCLLESSGNLDAALEAALLSVRLVPTWIESYVTLARVRCNRREFVDAMHSFSHALHMDGSRIDVRTELDEVRDVVLSSSTTPLDETGGQVACP